MPFIKRDFAESLLDKVDILDVISDYTELKKKGAHFFGLSPFQKESSPSFCVNKVKQRFNCYSSGKSGNVISFLMEHEKMSYPEALETLAKKYGIPVEYENKEQAKAYEKKIAEKNKLRPVIEASLLKYQKALVSLDETHPAKQEVFGRRQYNNDIVIDWQLGYAPGERFLFDLIKEKNLLKEGQELGIIGEKSDKYWERVIYPIHDFKGLLIGFAGRDVSGKENAAKWINPSDNPLYHKDKTWFALNRAVRSIIETGEANIVEGYNDVIAWHENGFINTIASCGTAITETQISVLSKYCKRINFTFDDDAPGKKAMLKYIPEFLAKGFRVYIQKTGGVDPDDFVRKFKDEITLHKNAFTQIKESDLEKEELIELAKTLELSEDDVDFIKSTKTTPERYSLQKVVAAHGEKVDGFKNILEEKLKGDAVEKSKAAYVICEMIAKITDESMLVIYMPWLAKESNISITKIKEWVKQAQAKIEAEENAKNKAANHINYNSSDAEYTLPDNITKTWDDVRNDVYKYNIFESDNRMWARTGSPGEYTFKPVTNCSVQIIQHMSDEEFPMKLLKIKNVYNIEKIFDAPSEAVDSQQRFTTLLSANGNFIYTGDSRDFLKLKVFLFDKMGVGRKIEVLGHQPEGFWVWNNLVQLYDGKTIDIDENGLFLYENVSYYVPSANKIYVRNPYKYEPQKKFKVVQANVSFTTFASKARQVHGDFAISGILFAICSLFQDIVIKERKSGFPILFLYGPPGTGKDEISGMIGSFYGEAQQAQNLEGGASTLKAKIIKLAQFCNGVIEFSEYKRADEKSDGILKGIWDRNGYERSNLTSKIAIESVPILSSLILTGNDYPNQEALITRLFANEMDKNIFTEEESKNYDEFKNMCSNGLSSYSVEILKHREYFKENFLKKFKAFRNSFKEVVPDGHQRMIVNASVLGATYELFKDILQFPFSFVDMQTYFKKSIERQMRKMRSESIINKFWDCFLFGIKSPENVRLMIYEDFKIEGRAVYFHFDQVFAKIAQIWFVIYKEAIPGKTFLTDQLKNSDAFVKYHSKGLKMDSGRDVKTSSGYEMDLEKTGLFNEIYDAVQYQLSIRSSIQFPPATPKYETSVKMEVEKDDLFSNKIISEDEF